MAHPIQRSGVGDTVDKYSDCDEGLYVTCYSASLYVCKVHMVCRSRYFHVQVVSAVLPMCTYTSSWARLVIHSASQFQVLVRIIAVLKASFIPSLAACLAVGAWTRHYIGDRQSPSLLSILASERNCFPDIPRSGLVLSSSQWTDENCAARSCSCSCSCSCA